MLVLSRRVGESVVIEGRDGELLVIKVCKMTPTQVQLSFQDDEENFAILREELVTRKESVNEQKRFA